MKTINVRDKLFQLAIVKGIVEHDDATAYFGSLLAFSAHSAEAVKLGWVIGNSSVSLKLTDLGRDVYHASGVYSMPRAYGTRAYMWRLFDIPETFEVSK